MSQHHGPRMGGICLACGYCDNMANALNTSPLIIHKIAEIMKFRLDELKKQAARQNEIKERKHLVDLVETADYSKL